MKNKYETPGCQEVALYPRGGVLADNSIFVTLALFGEEPGTDSRDMITNTSENW